MISSQELVAAPSIFSKRVESILFRMYQATGQQHYYEAGADGIAFETRLYNDQVKNWPDLLRSTKAEIVYGQTWCHGAPGIGLARLGGMPIFDNDHVRQDIQAALETTSSLFNNGLDTLCCGNAGRWDLLLKAGNSLQETKWIDHARQNCRPHFAKPEADGR